MANYAGWKYGGCPVWMIGGRYYKLLSKHKTLGKAKEVDKRRDDCDKIEKVGVWYGRFNRLPKQAVDRMLKKL